MFTKNNMYQGTILQVGYIVDANKTVGKSENGSFYAFYILDVKYPSGVVHKFYYYPDNKILTILGKEIIFEYICLGDDNIMLHIYK